MIVAFFFFNDTATTEIYTLSLHDALPILMLWWSAVIWFLFEAINFRLQDWYYVFLPASRLERWLGITISLATVVPAVLLGERVLDRLAVWRDLGWRPMALQRKHLQVAGWTGWGLLAAALAFPRLLHP